MRKVPVGLVPEPSNPAIKQIVEDVLAPIGRERAQRIRETIGEPGPGIDIIIRPTVPFSSHWAIEPKTAAGKRFIELFWFGGIKNSSTLVEFKRHTADWGLSFHTDWSEL